MTYALDEKNGFSVTASGNMRRLVSLAGGMFAIGTDSFVIAPLLPRIAEDVGVGVGVAAQLVTVYALAYAISSPLVATLTSRWAPERALIIGLAIFIVSNIGAAFAPDFLTVLLARCFAGLGAAVFAPMASATSAGLVPANKRAFALSVLMMGLSAATALGAPIGTLIGSFASWRTVFLLVALLAVMVSWTIGRTGSASAEVARIPLRERLRPLRNPMVLTNLLTVFLVLAGLYVSYTYISLIFDRVTHGDGAVMALLQSVWGVAGIAGAVIAGRLTDRLGSRVVIKIMLTVAALNFALLPFTSAHLSSAMVAIVIWGICGWGFVVPQQHRLIDFAPRSAPILLALYAMAVYGGTSVSGVLGAVGLEFMNRHQLPFIGVVLILAAIVVQEVSHRRFKELSYVT